MALPAPTNLKEYQDRNMESGYEYYYETSGPKYMEDCVKTVFFKKPTGPNTSDVITSYHFKLELLNDPKFKTKPLPTVQGFCPYCNELQMFYRPQDIPKIRIHKSFCSACGWLPKGRGKVSPKLRASVYETDYYECVYCGATEDLTLEHIQLHSFGGIFVENNLLTACKSCNSSRNNRQAKTPTFGRFTEIPF
jgi:hypothetical protein